MTHGLNLNGNGNGHYDFDAIVVGARCAGASTAMLLARQGRRVLLVDRARFPSDIPHGHFVHRHGPPRLARWGLLDRIVASGCPPVTSMTSYFGDFRLFADNLEVDGVAVGYGPRRAVLDKILVDAAVEAGAELHEGLAVEDVLTDGERVIGIRAGGTRITAELTIGADGRHSRIAQAVHAPVYCAAPTLLCWYFTYFSDVPEPGFEMYVLPQRRAIFVHPTHGDLLAVFVGWAIDEFPAVRANVEASFLAALDLAPTLGERVRAGRRAERFFGAADLPNFLRKPVGPGWALVGDAGCHKDPFMALGVCDALRDAELLAESLDTYPHRRDAATLPLYEENLHMARFDPVPPAVLEARQAARHSPQAATTLILARYGRLPQPAFETIDYALAG